MGPDGACGREDARERGAVLFERLLGGDGQGAGQGEGGGHEYARYINENGVPVVFAKAVA